MVFKKGGIDKDFISYGSFPSWLYWPQLDQGKARSQQPYLGLPHGWSGSRSLGHLALLFPDHLKAIKSEMEQLVLEPAPIFDAGRGGSFTCHTIVPAP